jgi:hypothetical protein
MEADAAGALDEIARHRMRLPTRCLLACGKRQGTGGRSSPDRKPARDKKCRKHRPN